MNFHELGGTIGSDEDTLVQSYEDHDDSVYSVAWSQSNAWLFASVSYHGIVMINFVPSSEKYKILL